MPAEHMSDDLRISRTDGVVTVTLNRPHRKNAITRDGWHELLTAFRQIAVPADRVVVLQGAAEDFCAGADLGADPSAGHKDLADHRQLMRVVGDACLALHRLPVPTVAKVDGVAVGAGMSLALACDLVIATTRSRFSQIFVKRGLSPDFGSSWFLPRLIGLRRAKELALLGEIVDAQSAEALGLLHRLVDPAELDEATAALVARLRAGPPVALGATKALLNNAFDVTLQQALDDEAEAQVINLGTRDGQEARTAFLEKRPAAFEGR
ncbi:enoyl-CoA hydratase/isomerase family protein [Blastococcus capsensis]|uniref:enoyl-CoA hydratase/isomerase family protein n=1 Tax=Blastococcus capsensis TaxID=1564163 RepID=UPI002540A2F1|nr:enoyl-CoA hydratase [Blastococcus capsensis]MDK3258958.1 enoyl-CoA hydratase [Blastococcus capsensis]